MGFVSDLFGAGDAKKAAKASAAGFQQAGQLYEGLAKQYNPYTELGGNAAAIQNALLSGDSSAFRESPGYQFAFDEGLRAVNNSGAARGMTFSGRQLKDLTRYGQGMANQEYYNYLNYLSGLNQSGQSALAGRGGALSGQANMITGGADARASGYLAKANIKNYLASSLHESGQRIGEAWATFGMGKGGGDGIGGDPFAWSEHGY